MNRIVISTEGELQELRENRVPKNTRQSTQFAVNLFQKSDMERTTCKQKVDGYIKKLQSEMQSPQSLSAPNIDRKTGFKMRYSISCLEYPL